MPKTKEPRIGKAQNVDGQVRVATNSSGKTTVASKEKQRTMVGDAGMKRLEKKGKASADEGTSNRIAYKREGEKGLSKFKVAQESAKYMSNLKKAGKTKELDTFKKTFLQH